MEVVLTRSYLCYELISLVSEANSAELLSGDVDRIYWDRSLS